MDKLEASVTLDHSYAKKSKISDTGNTEFEGCFSERVIKSIVKTQIGKCIIISQ